MTDSPRPRSPGLKGRATIALIRLLGHLPLPAARALGAVLALVLWCFRDPASRVTLRNLELCYPDLPADARRRLARRSMMHTGMLGLEICVLRRRSGDWLQARCRERHGEDLLRAEIAKGKGVILLAPHIGNWEVLSLMLPQYGQLTALYQPPKEAYLEDVIKTARQKTGAILVPTSPKGLARLLVSLRSGGITAVLPDQNPAWGNGAFSPFFGIDAYTMTTVHGFLRRTQCAVLMGVARRVPGGFATHYFPAPEGIYSEDVATSLAALNQGVEQCVALAPEQYQWEYKRFKKRPQGQPRLY